MRRPERQPPSVTNKLQKRSSFRPTRLIPLLFVVIIATLILRDRFHQVDDLLRSVLQPAQQTAINNCRKAALAQSESPDFARIIKWGEVSPTQNGFLVNRLVIGELAENEGERRIQIDCHTRMNGEVATSHRKPYPAKSTLLEESAPANAY